MPYTVTWNIKHIYIPASELTLISGSIYELDLLQFHDEIRQLEWGFADGLPWPQILDHTNPKLDFSGADYAGFDEVINGYTVTFDPVVSRVNLKGSNNNIVDIMVVNGVSAVSFNSAGLQLIASGSGLTQGQSDQLSEVHTWQDRIVHLNTELLVQGDGSQRAPFNTVASALDYAEANGIQKVFTFSDINVDRNLKNFSISGLSYPRIDLGGYNVSGSTFKRCVLRGDSAGDLSAETCELDTGFVARGTFSDCSFLGDFNQGADSEYTNCHSGVTGLGYATLTVDAGNAQVRGFLGSLGMGGIVAGDHSIGIISDGRFVLSATCTGGVVHLRGQPFDIVDGSAGTEVLDETAVLNAATKVVHGVDF